MTGTAATASAVSAPALRSTTENSPGPRRRQARQSRRHEVRAAV